MPIAAAETDDFPNEECFEHERMLKVKKSRALAQSPLFGPVIALRCVEAWTRKVQMLAWDQAAKQHIDFIKP